jgi:DNA-binding response OmpR family regulator
MRRAASAAARRSEFADTCGASGSGEAGKREFAITFRKASCVPASPPITNPARLRFDEFELDEANARLMRSGQAVALAPTPFNVLCALARQPGALMTKEALLDTVWGHQPRSRGRNATRPLSRDADVTGTQHGHGRG